MGGDWSRSNRSFDCRTYSLRRASADFEDESFYQEDEIMLEENDEPIEIPTGKPLDEFEDVVISDQPEKKERPSDSLISEVENTLEEIIEEEPVEEDPENDDDISVDEFGTEWYEDEVGTWWFREAENKTGPNTMNERRDIFQTLYDQRYGV